MQLFIKDFRIDLLPPTSGYELVECKEQAKQLARKVLAKVHAIMTSHKKNCQYGVILINA